ncbi:MAG: DUF2066 domain-containing protein [Alphaproteobacteria bacterium]|nr:DUF2066 domain-containing protein [Alphaproteobacteria bacterium]
MTVHWAARGLLALVVAAFCALPGAEAADELYVVRNVPVDAEAASAAEARDIAIAQGQAEAWTRMFRRLTPQSEWEKQLALTNEELAALVASLSVANEKRSSTRYLAEVTYTLDPQTVAAYMRRSGAAFSEVQTEPVLVIPSLDSGTGGTLWDINPWSDAWRNARLEGELVPVRVPAGDVEDVASVTPSALLTGEWEGVSAIASRYGAYQVVVATAVPAVGVVNVELRSIRPDGVTTDEVAVTGEEDDAALFARAIAEINARIQQDWKSRTAAMAGSGGQLSAEVSFSSLAEWAAIRKTVAESPLVRDMRVDGMVPGHGWLTFMHDGTPAQLANTLAARGIVLAEGPAGWTLAARAGPAVPEQQPPLPSPAAPIP